MSVLVSLKMSGDVDLFTKSLEERAEEFKQIAESAQGVGAIHHQFAVGPDYVLVVDEWDSAEQFEAFFSDPKLQTFIAEVGALAMGSTTYEWVLRHDEKILASTGSSWPYTQPTWIFTTRQLPSVPGADIRFASGDVRRVHAEMAAAANPVNAVIQLKDSLGLTEEQLTKLKRKPVAEFAMRERWGGAPLA